MKSFSLFLCAALLLLVPVKVRSNSPAEFGQLMMELENQMRYSSQYPTWPDKREGWKAVVGWATNAQALSQPLVDLETSITSEVQTDAWRSRRDAWIGEVRSAVNLNTLVDLLIEMEAAANWEATEDAWRTRRDGWLAEVRALKNAPGVSSAVSPGGASTAFGDLLLELENKTRLTSQYPAWPEKRGSWKASVSSAVDVRDFVEPLIDLEISIKSELQGGTWSSRREAWIKEVRAVQNMNTLIDLLIEMETPITWEALEEDWRTRRDGWLAEVRALKNTAGNGPNADGRLVESAGGFSISIPAGWEVRKAPEGKEFRQLFGITRQNFTPNINFEKTKDKRTIQDFVAASVADILEKYKELGTDGIKFVSQKSFTTASGLVGVRVAFRSSYRGFDARTLQYVFNGAGGQYFIVTGTALEADQATFDPIFDRAAKDFRLEASSRPQVTPLQASLSEYRDLLLELEQQLKPTSRSAVWPGHAERWKALTRASTTVPEFAGSLSVLGASTTWEVMSETWENRLDGWITEVKAAYTLNALVDLLIEMEAATKWEASEDSWRTQRDGWLTRVRKLKTPN